MRACLIIWWERFRGTQKEDDSGPLCIQILSALTDLLFSCHFSSPSIFVIILVSSLNIENLFFILFPFVGTTVPFYFNNYCLALPFDLWRLLPFPRFLLRNFVVYSLQNKFVLTQILFYSLCCLLHFLLHRIFSRIVWNFSQNCRLKKNHHRRNTRNYEWISDSSHLTKTESPGFDTITSSLS